MQSLGVVVPGRRGVVTDIYTWNGRTVIGTGNGHALDPAKCAVSLAMSDEEKEANAIRREVERMVESHAPKGDDADA